MSFARCFMFFPGPNGMLVRQIASGFHGNAALESVAHKRCRQRCSERCIFTKEPLKCTIW